MRKLVALMIEHGAGILGAIFAWVAGYIFIKDEEFVRLGLDIAGFFFGFAVSTTWRFESLFDSIITDVEKINDEMRQLTKHLTSMLPATRFLSNYFTAMEGANPLIKEILRNELLGFHGIVEDSSKGHISVSFRRQTTVIAYPQLFEYLQQGAHVRATLTLLPSLGTRQIMVNENAQFITQKNGTVERILLFSINDTARIAAWQRLAKEQKNAGVKIYFIFDEDLDKNIPIYDMFISTSPLMAVIATVGINAYSEIKVITDSDIISKRNQDYNYLFSQSHEFTTDDSITKAVQERAAQHAQNGQSIAGA